MAMKKKIVYTLLALFCSVSAAFCAPVLTCDCSPDADMITGGKLQFNGGAWIDIPVYSSCRDVVCAANSKTFCYDLGTMPNGAFSIRGRFVNIWSESPDSDPPLNGVKAGPSTSPSIKIKP